MSVLSKPYFHDEAEAFAHLERVLWPEGPVCPHCGSISGKHYDLRKTRLGLRKCSDCRKQFTVKVGTVFESAHIPLNKMLQAVYLMTASKKGISAHQLHRILEVQYKTAWFLAHRIREAMRSGDLSVPFGNDGGVVEVDETFIGNDRTKKPKGVKKGRGYAHKHKVLSLVDRETGQARSMVVDSLAAKDLTPILRENIAKEARVMTDEAGQYHHLHKEFAEHGFTRHGSGEYVSFEDATIHTNTIEGYFSIFKRGMKGVYQHCGKQHLHRYLAEFDFRYNNRSKLGCEDGERAVRALAGIRGKRLTYRWPNEESA
jgi:transposase-like protein